MTDKDDKETKDIFTETDNTIENNEENKTEDNTEKGKKTAPKHKRLKKEPDTAIIPADQLLPDRLTIVPIQNWPIFPGVFTPLMINAPEDIKVVEDAYNANGYIGIVMLKGEQEHPSVEDIYSIGTACRIVKKVNLPGGGLNIFISTLKRFKISKALRKSAPIAVVVEYLEDEESDSFEVKALTRALISEMKEVAENNPLFSDEMRLNMANVDNPGKIADFVASILKLSREDQQMILSTINVRERIEKILVFIKKEQELLKVQKRIQNELNERIEKSQREFFLREELRSIQEELGENSDGEETEYQKFKKKIDALNFEGEILETVKSELSKFSMMDPNSSEYIVTRNYLELITQLPWEVPVFDDYNLGEAQKILEKDHFGLDDVKKRIVEYLAVRKLKKDCKGSILILVGPPGVGKTSVGKSIASAMNKPFYRFSVGGMRDESEIKGHRRTYVGAMPGKIIQGLKITKSNTPVFLIDEVDKMGSSHQGDPAAALLEVLDPEQNINFRDNYLDLPFDISNVFFILTANSLDTIPSPLLDRAEIIQLSGYIDQEKLEIAKKYIIPKNLVKNGLKKNQVKYTKNALLTIAEEYARESGVRNYEKCIDKIHRKLVTEIIVASETPEAEQLGEKTFSIDSSDLAKYLGKPVFDESEIKVAKVPGTAIGLAWTSMGGDTLLIESTCFAGKGGLVLTGQMGDVMKESSQISFNWARKFVLENGKKKAKWFDENIVHLHIPEGATPKDGPSAGITMATAFVSLFMNKKIKPNLAMTGELSLTGQVLPIGGLREKTVAAKRNKIKTIIIPKANEKDLDEIPENVKSGIKFIPVTDVMEVLKIALGI